MRTQADSWPRRKGIEHVSATAIEDDPLGHQDFASWGVMQRQGRSKLIFLGFGGIAVVAIVLCVQLLGSSQLHRTRGRKQSKVSPTPSQITAGWKLVFNSTFKGSSLNRSIWRPGWFGSGITPPVNKNEPACYNSDQITFPGDGTVHMGVTHNPVSCSGHTEPYTSSIVTTNPSDGRASGGFQYRYGLLQVRADLPGKAGLFANWVSIMTLGQHWPEDGEDDLFETIFGYPCHSIHSRAYVVRGLYGCDHKLAPGWHTISVNWAPKYIAWYYDGVKVGVEHTGVTSSPMYIAIVNTVSNRALTMASPDQLRIRYVRLWQPIGKADADQGYFHQYS